VRDLEILSVRSNIRDATFDAHVALRSLSSNPSIFVFVPRSLRIISMSKGISFTQICKYGTVEYQIGAKHDRDRCAAHSCILGGPLATTNDTALGIKDIPMSLLAQSRSSFARRKRCSDVGGTLNEITTKIPIGLDLLISNSWIRFFFNKVTR
jgi:hypothetical protein